MSEMQDLHGKQRLDRKVLQPTGEVDGIPQVVEFLGLSLGRPLARVGMKQRICLLVLGSEELLVRSLNFGRRGTRKVDRSEANRRYAVLRDSDGVIVEGDAGRENGGEGGSVFGSAG